MSGAIGGSMVTRRSKKSSDKALQRDSIGNDFGMEENLLLPYDQLVEMGRVAPNQPYYAQHGGESRLSRGIAGYEESLATSDPIFASYRKTVQSGLEGLDSGIPDDLRRSITEGLRSSQASRGILDSNTAAIEEVVRLMGGQEQVRAQRLGEANNYFNSVTQGALNSLLPNINTLYGGELERSKATQSGRLGAVGLGTGVASSTLNVL